jgi:nucleotide-binding universal stress UspA family protein
MFKRILVPLDGSENSERVIPWAKQYARKAKSEVYLLRVVTSAGAAAAQEVQEAWRYLQGWEREFNYANVPAKVLVREGPPADAIVRAARLRSCDAIVMATRGGSLVQRWLIGGVTEQVMRMSTQPVLVVRSQLALPKQGRVRRILVPMDGSPLAERVVPVAERFARFHRARVEFVHVYPTGPAGGLRTNNDDNYDALRRRMVRKCQDLRARGVRAAFRVERGDAATEILRLAARRDLVVMTTHGYGGFKRWVFGSVAEKVIHESGVPVYVHKTAPRMATRLPAMKAGAG